MSNIFLNNLVGIPASGKSTFCQNMVQLASTNQLKFNVIHICYDDFIKFSDFTADYLESQQYKRDRFRLRLLVQQLITDIKVNRGFENSEKMALIEFQKSSFRVTFYPGLQQYLLLIDDNMYYRSMQNEIRNIAKTNETGYFITYFHCTLENALIRNQGRHNTVPEKFIRQMHAKLEQPCFSYILYADIDNLQAPSMANIEQIMLDQSKCSIWDNADESHSPPAEHSLIHAVDLMLRKEINRRMKSLDIPTKERAGLAEILCAKRKYMLSELKVGNIAIPEDINELKLYIVV